jgi:hypothetical protein
MYPPVDSNVVSQKRPFAPTPYSDLNQVLYELTNNVQVILQSNFVGAYLQGSFAVGDFDQHSDVDFIILTTGELTDHEVGKLQVMHNAVYRLESAWAQHLEGSYISRDTLGHDLQGIRPLWYLDNGANSLIQDTHCNTILVRWVLREKGIILAGPAPANLIDPISVLTLRRYILRQIQNWGSEILANPEPYNNRFYQSYLVLSYCRMFHDLQNGFPGSKRSGANWAKQHLDPMWTTLIDQTWDARPKPEITVRQRADPSEFQETLEFVRYVIAQSYAYAAANGIGADENDSQGAGVG